MPENEATEWCRTWSLEQDVSQYTRWTPEVGDPTGVLGEAVELVWEEIKILRGPCLTGDGRPSIWFKSNPTVNPGSIPQYDLGDAKRAATFEYNTSIHNPILPDRITLLDYSKRTEATPKEPGEMILDSDTIGNHTPAFAARFLIFPRLDFSGFWTQREFCGGWWTNELKRAERGLQCPRCGMVGTGEGRIGNERRFYHERNRSCYLGVVENRLKRNPLVKCAKCGEMGREHHGKDGHVRIRHADTTCYIG